MVTLKNIIIWHMIHIHQKSMQMDVQKRNLFSDFWMTCSDDLLYGDDYKEPFRVPGIFNFVMGEHKAFLRNPKKITQCETKQFVMDLIHDQSSLDPLTFFTEETFSLHFDPRNPDNLAFVLDKQNLRIPMSFVDDCINFFSSFTHEKYIHLPPFESCTKSVSVTDVSNETMDKYRELLVSSSFVHSLNAGEMQEYITCYRKKPINFISVSDDLPFESFRAILDHGITSMKRLITKDDPLFIYFTSQSGNHLIYITTDKSDRDNYAYMSHGDWLLQRHIDAITYILPRLQESNKIDFDDNKLSDIQKVIYESLPYEQTSKFTDLLNIPKSDPNHYLMQHESICYQFRLRYPQLTTVEYRKRWSERVQNAECFCQPNTPKYSETITQMYANEMRREYKMNPDALKLDYELAQIVAFLGKCQEQTIPNKYWGRPRMILYFLYNFLHWTNLRQQ